MARTYVMNTCYTCTTRMHDTYAFLVYMICIHKNGCLTHMHVMYASHIYMSHMLFSHACHVFIKVYTRRICLLSCACLTNVSIKLYACFLRMHAIHEWDICMTYVCNTYTWCTPPAAVMRDLCAEERASKGYDARKTCKEVYVCLCVRVYVCMYACLNVCMYI